MALPSSLENAAAADHRIGAELPPATERLSELRAVVGLVNGRPELIARYHTSPLKIAKTFALSAGDWRQLAVVQMDGSPDFSREIAIYSIGSFGKGFASMRLTKRIRESILASRVMIPE